MAAPNGNRNAAKGKEWTYAIRRALKRYETDDIKRGKALFSIANKLVEEALNGKEHAIREISERLDGKVNAGDSGGNIKVLVVRDVQKLTGPELQDVRVIEHDAG